LNCTGAGACGFNGIPPQTLTTSKTMTGSLLGGEVGMPLRNVPVLSSGATAFTFLSAATVGFQYLHGEFGSINTAGAPSRIQITATQDVRTDSVMATLRLPLGALAGLW
jgi:hypothetical protein